MNVRSGRVLFSGALLLGKPFQSLHVSTGLHKYECVSAIKIGMQQVDNRIQFDTLNFKQETGKLYSCSSFLSEQIESEYTKESPHNLTKHPDTKDHEITKPDLNKLCNVVCMFHSRNLKAA